MAAREGREHMARIVRFMNCEECDKDIGTARYCLWCGHDNSE